MYTKIAQVVTVAAVALSLVACNPQSAEQVSSITAWGGSYYDQGSLWAKIGDNPGMDIDTSRPDVQKQIKFYQVQQDYLKHIVEQSRPLIYYVYDQTQQQSLPAVLALLPYVESDYNPKGREHTGADGLWQLMPATAKGLGVKYTGAYNGRHDVVASTSAAFKYLNWLYKYYDNNWPLALAAYNAGNGRVDAAIRYNKARGLPTDYWSLKSLPRETREYVPKLIALAAIVRYSRYYHIELPKISDQPYVEPVKHSKPINLAFVAKLAGVPVDTVRKLNPAFKHAVADAKGPYTLLIPADKADQLKTRMAQLSPEQLAEATKPAADENTKPTSKVAKKHSKAKASKKQLAASKSTHKAKRTSSLAAAKINSNAG